MAVRTSVIIPTYNITDYIIQAIGSALFQIYKDFEFKIIDDDSSLLREP